MRSRMSRGVSEWSRGKDLYMGSHILGSGKRCSFLVLYREASRRFQKLPEKSGNPPRVLPRPKGQHGLRGDAMALLGQARTSPSRPMQLGKVESPPLFGREGGLDSTSSPLGCALGFGGDVLHDPPPIYRGEGRPKRTPKALGAPLSPVTP